MPKEGTARRDAALLMTGLCWWADQQDISYEIPESTDPVYEQVMKFHSLLKGVIIFSYVFASEIATSL